MKKEISRRKKLLTFFARSLCFLLVLCVALSYTVYVLTPKHDFGICSMINFYRLPKDSVDVLVLGTSLAYSGINTNVLWREHGIAAYDLCCAEQPFWVSYYYLKEALKTQKPRLILLDAKASIYQDEFSSRARTIMSTYGIRSLDTRYQATKACVGEGEAFSYLLGFPQVHAGYKEITKESFVYPTTNGGRGQLWNGYIEVEETMEHERPSVVWAPTKRELSDKGKLYVEKIIELANTYEIPVMLVGLPNPDYSRDHMYYNALFSLCAENGVKGINYNDPQMRFGLRYSSDFADYQHLNVKGSVTFSRKLGADLVELYELSNRLDEDAYAYYAACAQQWYLKYSQYAPEGAL